MSFFALCMPAAIFAVTTHSFVLAMSLISLAMAAHQAWSANLFTLPSDLFPTKMVGSVVGVGGAAGAIGAMFMTLVVGGFLQTTHDYVPLFVVAGLLHPLALLSVFLLLGKRMPKADLEPHADTPPSPGLKIAATAVTLAGATILGAVAWEWKALCARSASAAAQGLVVGVALILLGLALFYASRDRRHGGSPLPPLPGP
jgi:hypothetical protein